MGTYMCLLIPQQSHRPSLYYSFCLRTHFQSSRPFAYALSSSRSSRPFAYALASSFPPFCSRAHFQSSRPFAYTIISQPDKLTVQRAEPSLEEKVNASGQRRAYQSVCLCYGFSVERRQQEGITFAFLPLVMTMRTMLTTTRMPAATGEQPVQQGLQKVTAQQSQTSRGSTWYFILPHDFLCCTLPLLAQEMEHP